MNARISELVASLRNDPDVSAWDSELARAIGVCFVAVGVLPVAERLRFVGLYTADDVKRAWQRNRSVVRAQFVERLRGQGQKPMGRGISLFHLAQVLAVRNGGVDELCRLFAIREAPVHVGHPGEVERIARAITDAIAEVEGESRVYFALSTRSTAPSGEKTSVVPGAYITPR